MVIDHSIEIDFDSYIDMPSLTPTHANRNPNMPYYAPDSVVSKKVNESIKYYLI